MASKLSGIALAAAAVAVLIAVASAQSTSGCTSAIVSLAPCLGYITGATSTPSSSCCSQLAAVVKGEPQCLCVLLDGGAASFGITLNQTKALELPGACKVQTPPASLCNAGAPAKPPTASVPDPAPAAASATSAAAATAGSSGSKATQTSGGVMSYKSSNSQLLMAAFLLVATASFFTN